MSAPAPRSIIAIDLLRFCCAMLVLCYHFGTAFWLAPSPHGHVLLYGTAAPVAGTGPAEAGWVGVELFFVISGMVIAKSAIDIRWHAFAAKRMLRLIPAAWLCATFTAIVLGATGCFGSPLIGEYARSIAFWPLGPQIDGSYWTLGIECAFYLLVAICIGRGAGMARIEAIGLALGTASVAFWLWCIWSGPASVAVIRNAHVNLLLLPYGCFFAIGISITAIGSGRATPSRLLFLALLIGAALVEIHAHAFERALDLKIPPAPLLAKSLFIVGIAVLLGANRLQPLLARWIREDLARSIGLMTYPLYLLHQDLGAAVLAGFAGVGLPTSLAAAMAAAVVIALAWVVAHSLEPALRGVLRSVGRTTSGRLARHHPDAGMSVAAARGP